MKTAIQKAFIYLMVGIIFMSSTGFGLLEYSCTMSGKTETAFLKKEGCCSKSKTTTVKHTHGEPTIQKGKCCEEEEEYVNVDFSASLIQKTSTLLTALCIYIVNAFVSLFYSIFELFKSSMQLSSSPPYSGRHLLTLIQTLRI